MSLIIKIHVSEFFNFFYLNLNNNICYLNLLKLNYACIDSHIYFSLFLFFFFLKKYNLLLYIKQLYINQNNCKYFYILIIYFFIFLIRYKVKNKH